MAESEYWLRIAEEDWMGVQNELESRRTIWRIVCFLSQSAAEKFLKAFLTAHGVEPERIHDLDELLESCIQFDDTLKALYEDANRLSFFAVDARYPEREARYDEQAARLAVTAAENIRTAILQRVEKQHS